MYLLGLVMFPFIKEFTELWQFSIVLFVRVKNLQTLNSLNHATNFNKYPIF